MTNNDEARAPETSPERRSLRAKVALLGVIILGGVLALAVVANLFAGLVAQPDGGTLAPGIPVKVSIEPGSAASTIYAKLDGAGVVAYGAIEAAAREADAEGVLQPGTYDFVTGMEPGEVLRLLIEGTTAPDSRTITIVEGWTVDRIARALGDATEYTAEQFLDALRTGAVTSPLLDQAPQDLDPVMRWEGLLYPAKYQIPEGSTPARMLQTMADELLNRFESLDWSPLETVEISRYQALIIGSLIEWEAGTEADRPLISSVIHNRLAVPMRLQIDATVIYALGENPGIVTAEHLKIKSPYNTYLIDGLPPTPIGAVSTASLKAAISPAATDYLFYVLSSPDGSHAFAATYEEHQANVRAAKDAGVLP